jgi:hypothetical protein
MENSHDKSRATEVSTMEKPPPVYLAILDVWSNVSIVGPFEDEAAAIAYRDKQNPAFDFDVMSQAELDSNFAEFGALPIAAPNLESAQ